MAYTILPNNPEMKGLVELIGNVVFAHPDGYELAMHILKPMWKSDNGGFPLVVFVQGSAWTKPNQFWEIPQLSRLAERGFVVATVTHRSAFEAKAPAFLEDVKTSIRFLKSHAADYDIDPTKVCIWGTSSGGNTALLVGLTQDAPLPADAEWPDADAGVQAVVDCFGPTDLMRMMTVQYADSEDPSLFYALGGGDSVETCRETMEAISPICYVTPGRAFPPFLILHGDADPVVLYSDTEVLYNRLVECGYEADLVRVTGAPHEGNFWSERLLETIFQYIQTKVGK